VGCGGEDVGVEDDETIGSAVDAAGAVVDVGSIPDAEVGSGNGDSIGNVSIISGEPTIIGSPTTASGAGDLTDEAVTAGVEMGDTEIFLLFWHPLVNKMMIAPKSKVNFEFIVYFSNIFKTM